MSAQLERMNARLNAYSNTEVGSSNFPKPKTSTGVQIDNDQQSPKTLGKRKVYDLLHVIILFLSCITTNGMYFDYCIG